MKALTTYITTTPKTESNKEPELRLKIRTACVELSSESAKTLRELSSAIRTMTAPTSAKSHVAAAVTASGELGAALSMDADLADVLHVAATATLLAERVGTDAGDRRLSGGVGPARPIRGRRTVSQGHR
ncbi:putative Aluminum-activated malate transporter 1 [Cocos nucifera]|uniref:Putative Aluminum-activated malate transporter 1 n=1 Tax=Cocos nucifera TaxID=13894 RepID=A0A8K0NDI2_COCNU|nr:putative Aluminum-activated malate transporter 1 [Cocos nucifera]